MRSLTIVVPFVVSLSLILCIPLTGTSASPKTGADGEPVTACDVEAYLDDPDVKGTNVRSGPGSTHKIIGHIPNRKKDGLGVGIHVTGSQGDWVRIDRAVEEGGDDERLFFKGEGWVYAPLLAGSGIGGGANLYKEPAAKSPVIGRVSHDDKVAVNGCKGKWVLVRHKKLKGWMAPRTFCPSSLTTCS